MKLKNQHGCNEITDEHAAIAAHKLQYEITHIQVIGLSSNKTNANNTLDSPISLDDHIDFEDQVQDMQVTSIHAFTQIMKQISESMSWD